MSNTIEASYEKFFGKRTNGELAECRRFLKGTQKLVHASVKKFRGMYGNSNLNIQQEQLNDPDSIVALAAGFQILERALLVQRQEDLGATRPNNNVPPYDPMGTRFTSEFVPSPPPLGPEEKTILMLSTEPGIPTALFADVRKGAVSFSRKSNGEVHKPQHPLHGLITELARGIEELLPPKELEEFIRKGGAKTMEEYLTKNTDTMPQDLQRATIKSRAQVLSRLCRARLAELKADR